MADFPFRGDGCLYADYGILTASTNFTQLTTPTVNNAKGAWLEIVPSLAVNARGLIVNMVAQTTGSRNYLADIGVGPGGSEQVLASNLLEIVGTSGPRHTYYLPVHVPARTRIAMRYQAQNITGADLRASITALSAGFYAAPPWSRVITIGSVVADSGGTTVTALNGVKGSYSQLTNSLPANIQSMIIAIGNANSDFTLGSEVYLFDIAVGASGSEYDVLKNFRVFANGSTDTWFPTLYGPIPMQIPAGTRISARALAGGSSIDSFDIILYGFN